MPYRYWSPSAAPLTVSASVRASCQMSCTRVVRTAGVMLSKTSTRAVASRRSVATGKAGRSCSLHCPQQCTVRIQAESASEMRRGFGFWWCERVQSKMYLEVVGLAEDRALCREYGARVHERLSRQSRQVRRPDVHRALLMKCWAATSARERPTGGHKWSAHESRDEWSGTQSESRATAAEKRESECRSRPHCLRRAPPLKRRGPRERSIRPNKRHGRTRTSRSRLYNFVHRTYVQYSSSDSTK